MPWHALSMRTRTVQTGRIPALPSHRWNGKHMHDEYPVRPSKPHLVDISSGCVETVVGMCLPRLEN